MIHDPWGSKDLILVPNITNTMSDWCRIAVQAL